MFLAIVYLIIVGGASYVQYRFMRGVTPLQPSQLSLIGIHRGCVFSFPNDLAWINRVIMVATETLATGLLVVSQRRLRFTNGLLDVMVKDGVGYFLCSIALTITDLGVLRGTSEFVVPEVLLIAQAVLQGILCNRLLFHVHVVNEERTRPWSCASAPVILVELRQVPTQRRRQHLAMIPK